MPSEVFRQQRTIRQADSARDFSSSQGLKSAGILCVFQTFQTAELAEKIRRSAQTQLRGVAFTQSLLQPQQPTRMPARKALFHAGI